MLTTDAQLKATQLFGELSLKVSRIEMELQHVKPLLLALSDLVLPTKNFSLTVSATEPVAKQRVASIEVMSDSEALRFLDAPGTLGRSRRRLLQQADPAGSLGRNRRAQSPQAEFAGSLGRLRRPQSPGSEKAGSLGRVHRPHASQMLNPSIALEAVGNSNSAAEDRDRKFIEAEKKELEEKSFWGQVKRTISISHRAPNAKLNPRDNSRKSNNSKLSGKSSLQPVQIQVGDTNAESSVSKSSSSDSGLDNESSNIHKVHNLGVHQQNTSSKVEHSAKHTGGENTDGEAGNSDASFSSILGSAGASVRSADENEQSRTMPAEALKSEESASVHSTMKIDPNNFIIPVSPDITSVEILVSPATPHTQRSMKSSKILSAIAKVASTAKYDERGSFISESVSNKFSQNHDQSGSKIWDYPRLISVLKYGLNSRASFVVGFELFMGVFYIAIAWAIPFYLGFTDVVHFSFSIVLTATYALDTFIEAITFRASHPQLLAITEPKLKDWQRVYFQNFFWIDLISAIPFEILPFDNSSYLIAIRLIRLYKLPNLINKSPKFVALRKAVIAALGVGEGFAGVFPLTFALCLFLHVETCAIFLVGKIANFSNAIIAQVQYVSVGEQYVWALFNAVGNTFSMSYMPSSTIEQIVILIFILFGAALYAAIVGSISSFAMGMDASGKLYKQKIDELREYMDWKDLSNTTRRKVLKYYELKYRGKFFEEATLLGEMNESLKMEIAMHNCKQLIQKVSFLKRETGDGRDELFLGRIAAALTACYFVPGDVIITQGEIGIDMYFILSGSVDILVNGKCVTQFHTGAFFGEVGLMANIPRTASVQAASYCSLYRLTRADFSVISAEFLDIKQRMEVVYQERMINVQKEAAARTKSSSTNTITK